MHGRDAGRPPIHGRASKYAQAFGDGFRLLVNDPEILKSNAELALFDQFLGERVALLSDNFSGEWLEDVRDALGGLRSALFEKPNAQAAKAAFERLERLTETGGERVAAWEELLDKAGQRSAMASRARSAEAHVTLSDMVGHFADVLRILLDVAGPDVTRKVKLRYEREVLGPRGLGPGVDGDSAGAVN